MEPGRSLGLRLLLGGPPLLALLTLAALAAWRVHTAPLAPPVPGPAGGLRATPGLLLLTPTEVDLGCVEPTSRHEVPLAWRREGVGALRLLAQDLGCGCLGLEGLPSTFPEGSCGSARLTLAASRESGPVESYVRVVLDVPPPQDVVRVCVRAFVGRGVVVRPAGLDLGRRTGEGRAASSFEVHLPPGADAAGVAVEVLGWPGTVRVEPSRRRGRNGPDLVLDSSFPGAPGAVTGALRVRTASAGEAVVPLRAEVVAVAPSVSAPSARPGPSPPW